MRTPESGRPSKITAEVKALVERQMRHDDETTAAQLHVLLVRSGSQWILRTVLRCRTYLGWTFRGSSYCQLIRHENKQKRLGRGYIANSLERCPESHGLCSSRLPVAKMTDQLLRTAGATTDFAHALIRYATPALRACDNYVTPRPLFT